MRKTLYSIKVWFWAVTHAWTLAKANASQAAHLSHVRMVDVCANQGVVIAIRGSCNGWSANLAKGRATLQAGTLMRLLDTIANLPNAPQQGRRSRPLPAVVGHSDSP